MKRAALLLLGMVVALTFGAAYVFAADNYAPVMGESSLSNGITYFGTSPDCLGTGSAAGGISMAEPEHGLWNGITSFKGDVGVAVVKNSCYESIPAKAPELTNGITVFSER